MSQIHSEPGLWCPKSPSLCENLHKIAVAVEPQRRQTQRYGEPDAMSRSITSERMNRLVTDAELQRAGVQRLYRLSRAVYDSCMTCVTSSIQSDADGARTVASTERLTIILSTAQISQTLFTLCQTGSSRIPNLTRACQELCLLCAEVCGAMRANPEYAACATACRDCADVCQETLSRLKSLHFALEND